MEDVLDVYKRPYDPAYPKVCMDESNKQLTQEVLQPIFAAPGRVKRIDYEYQRNGTSNIFLGVEPLKGRSFIQITDRRTRLDWAVFIKELVDIHYPSAKKIVLVMDNLNTHNGASLYETFEAAEAKRILDKLEIHYTPKHGSWLNMAEIDLSHLSRQCLDRRIPDQATLRREVEMWRDERNKRGAPINWQFTCEDARVKLSRLYPSI